MTDGTSQGAFQLRDGTELFPVEGGGVALQFDPLQAVRVNPSAFEMLEKCRDGFPDSSPTGQDSSRAAFFDTLCDLGILDWVPSDAAHKPTVSVVIPVYNRSRELKRCIESLGRLNYPREKLEIIVVDDGSEDDSAEVARSFRAHVISVAPNRGQAAARNLGALDASGEIIAFTDSDCVANPGWLAELIPFFRSRRFALVGGRVDSYYRSRLFERYEETCSPLNMGAKRVEGAGPGSVFYVPTCNMLVEKRAFNQVGGFDEHLRFGEDVDLCWKLLQAGHRLIYLPRGAVAHKHRSHLRGSLRQRFDYGTSEAVLYDRHQRVRKRFPLRPAQALFVAILAWALTGQATTALPLLLALVTGEFLAKSRDMRQRLKIPLHFKTIFKATFKSYFALTYHLTYHLLRYYLFPLFAMTLLFPRLTLLLLVTVGLPAAVVFTVRKPAVSFPAFWLFFVLDQAFYQAGVIRGCLTTGSLRPYRMSFRKRARYV